MKRNVCFLSMVVITIIFSFTAIGQVKQIFLFKDAVTNKPLENVQLNIIGEKQVISNSKGIAIVTSNKNKIGDDYFIKSVRKDGYIFLGKNWKTSAYFSVFSKDTLEYIFCTQAEYRKICNLYYNAMMKNVYNNLTDYYNYLSRTLKETPEDIIDINQVFLSTNLFSSSLDATQNMPKITDIMKIDYNIRKEYEDLIAKGEVRKAIDILESKINENDLSEKNLMLVDYYLQILNLDYNYLNSFDLTPYHKLLATKRPYANIDYLLSVMDSKEYDIKEEYPKIKDKIQTQYNNYFALYFYNHALAGEDEDKQLENAKAFADNMAKLNNDKENIYAIDVARQYSFIASIYLNMQDTANAVIYRNKMLDLLDKVTSDDNIETIYNNISAVRSIIAAGTSSGEDSVYDIKINNLVKQKLEQNHNIDSLLLIARIPYINMNIANMRIDNETKQEYKIRNNYIQSLVKDIKPNCDEYFSVQEMRLKYNEMINAIDYDTMLQNWQKLNTMYNHIDSIYPDMFIGNQYYSNNYFLEFAQRYGQEQDVKNIIENNDELLKKLKNYREFDANYFLSHNNNNMAEYYYSINQYEKALPYYDKEEKYLKELAIQDSSYYIELCRHYLQKGDAYVYINQVEKGIDCYSKVNDLEFNIPEQYKEEYDNNKVTAIYFTADAYRIKKDYKKAIKYLDKAEKGYRQLVQTDQSNYLALAELFYSRSDVWDSLGNKKKSFNDLELSYFYYRMLGVETPSRKYVAVQKDILQAYLERKDMKSYIEAKINFIKTLMAYSYSEPQYLYDYTEQCYSFAYELKNAEQYAWATEYFQETVNYMDTIQYLGGEINYTDYMRANYQLANGYAIAKDYDTAIYYYNRCLELNKAIKDTNESLYYENNKSINLMLANVYEDISDMDTVNKYDKTKIDSLIVKYQTDAVNDFAHLNITNNIEMQYDYAKAKQKLAFYKIMSKSMTQAEQLLQESNDIALQFNVNPYKKAAADVIMYNHILLGSIYENNDRQNSKNEYYKALNIYNNLTKEDKKGLEKHCAVASENIIDILIYDENMQDQKEIKRLQKNIEKYKKQQSK